jgi:hypothetical protein
MMEPESKEFLFKEYDAIWGEVERITNTRDKIIAIYFAFIGAVASAGFALFNSSSFASKPCSLWIGELFLGSLVCLPREFVVPSTLFIVLVSLVASLSLSRLHTLGTEYWTALNRMRKAFVSADPTYMRRAVLLPTIRFRAGGFRLDFWVLTVTVATGGLVLSFLVTCILNWCEAAHLLNRTQIVRFVPGVVFILYVVFAMAVHFRRCRIQDRNLRSKWKRSVLLATWHGNR